MVKEGGRKNPKHPFRGVLREGVLKRSSPGNLLHIFRIRFYKNTSGGLFWTNLNTSHLFEFMKLI